LTAENPAFAKDKDRYFPSLDDVIMAYEQKEINLHSYIMVRFHGKSVHSEPEKLASEERSSDGQFVTKTYVGEKSGILLRRVREDAEGNLINQYIRTTPGRIIFNKTIENALR
jgi:DNA-directed RNA polymerase subunit beta'